MKVYIVNWEQIMDDYTEWGTIGVYQSELDARVAISNLHTGIFDPLPTVTIYETQLGSQCHITPSGTFVNNLTLIDKIKL